MLKHEIHVTIFFRGKGLYYDFKKNRKSNDFFFVILIRFSNVN